MNRAPILITSLLSLALAAGCPSPPAQEPGEQPLQAGGAPAEDPAAAPGEPGDPSAAPVPQVVPIDPSAPPPAPGDGPARPLSFTDLITQGGGQTVTISGDVHGATKGQINFVAVVEREGQKYPEHLQESPFQDGHYSVEAPAHCEHPIVITAVVLSDDRRPGPDEPSGSCAKPVTLAGKDITCDITIGEHDDPSEFYPAVPVHDPSAHGGGQAPGGVPTGGEPPAPPPADDAAGPD
ncbi:MAG: hypothetical protein ABIO70_22735 [Pseudomonadota bacterium]